MAAFVFPPAPASGTVVTNPNSGADYRWDGAKWRGSGIGGSGAWLPLSGGEITGALVVDGALTVRGPTNFGP